MIYRLNYCQERLVYAIVIHNPIAGRAKRHRVSFTASLNVLRTTGWSLDVVTTTGVGSATELAKDAVARGADIVVAAGGDGTINEIIQALAHTTSALGCLPLGTVNIWAREVGYPLDPVQAAAAMTAGRVVKVDLGYVNGRYFLLMAGIGFDGAVTAAVSDGHGRKQRFGRLAYALETITLLPRYHGARFALDIDGRTCQHDALMLLVSNTRLYGGLARLTPEAVVNDGQLDVRVFTGHGPVDSVRYLLPILLHGAVPSQEHIVRARAITVDAEPPVPVQVDGEPCGITPARIHVERGALCALVPPGYDTSFIQESA
jgi:diacylglycerol kinase (ATP)